MAEEQVKPEGWISDEDMARLEASPNKPAMSTKPEGWMSDEDMSKLESQQSSPKVTESKPLGPMIGLGPLGLAPAIPAVSSFLQSHPTISDFARHAASLGGITGPLNSALQAGSDILQDPQKLRDAYQLYKQHQKENSDALKQSSDRSPIASTAGDIAGSIPPLLAGGGLLAKLGLGGAVPLSQALDEGFIPLASELAKRTAASGILGGTAAGLASDKTIEQPQALGKDVLNGALLGAGTGLGANIAGLGAQTAGNALLDKFPAIKTALQRGTQGVNLAGPTGQKNAQQNVLNTAQELADDLQNTQKELSTGYEALKPPPQQISQSASGPTQLIPMGEPIPPPMPIPAPLPVAPGQENVAQLNQKYYNFKEGLRQLNISNTERNQPKNIYNLANQLAGPPRQAVLAQNKLAQGIAFLKEVNPELAEKMGQDLQSTVNDLSIANQSKLPTSIKDLVDIRGNTMGLSNIAGQVKYQVDNSVLGKLMTNMPRNTGVNATMFNMLQNPATRPLLMQKENK